MSKAKHRPPPALSPATTMFYILEHSGILVKLKVNIWYPPPEVYAIHPINESMLWRHHGGDRGILFQVPVYNQPLEEYEFLEVDRQCNKPKTRASLNLDSGMDISLWDAALDT